MTGSPTPGREHRPLKPLLDEAPPPGPPDWLDANIRTAAHAAARKADATRAAGGRAADTDRKRWRWGPIGAVAAVALLGLLIVISQPRRTNDATLLAQAPAPAPENVSPPAALGRSSVPSDTSADAPAPKTDRATPADVPGSQSLRQRRHEETRTRDRVDAAPLKDASPSDAKREAGPADGGANVPPRSMGPEPAPPPAQASASAKAATASPAAPATAGMQGTSRAGEATTAASAEGALAALPDTAQKCVTSVETMRREQRIDDARRRLRDCRERFPDHPYPSELLHALPPPAP